MPPPLHPFSSLPLSVFALHLPPLLLSLLKGQAAPSLGRNGFKTKQNKTNPEEAAFNPGLADTGLFQPPPGFYWGKSTYYRE